MEVLMLPGEAGVAPGVAFKKSRCARRGAAHTKVLAMQLNRSSLALHAGT